MSTLLKFLGVATLVVVAFLVGVGGGYDAGYDEGFRAANQRAATVDHERCQRLAALIPPITAEIDRVLASGGRNLHDLEMRRIQIRGEMRLEGCR